MYHFTTLTDLTVEVCACIPASLARRKRLMLPEVSNSKVIQCHHPRISGPTGSVTTSLGNFLGTNICIPFSKRDLMVNSHFCSTVVHRYPFPQNEQETETHVYSPNIPSTEEAFTTPMYSWYRICLPPLRECKLKEMLSPPK